MADETPITITGNLTADPEVRTSQNGPIVSFTVAHQTRTYDRQAGQYGNGRTSFYRCTAFRSLAQNIASSGWRKGQRVIVTGYIEQHQWQAEDGTSRSNFQVVVQDAGVSLLFGSKDPSPYGVHQANGQYAPQAGQSSPSVMPPSQPAPYNPWNNPQPQSGQDGFSQGAPVDFNTNNQGV